jgi:uncharacterized RDD family membrane protein YckC
MNPEPPPTGSAPVVGWAPPPPVAEIPGAPGLAFADTATRVVAYLVDIVIVGIAVLFIGGMLGLSRTTVTYVAPNTTYESTTPLALLLTLAINAAYFPVSWTGGRRATLGQRLFHLQVGNAFDGAALSMERAFRRWIVLGAIPELVSFFSPVRGTGSGLEVLWFLVLLVSTATSPTKQGLHDRFAKSAVVAPSGVARSGIAMGLLLIVAVVAVLAFAFITVGLRALAAG